MVRAVGISQGVDLVHVAVGRSSKPSQRVAPVEPALVVGRLGEMGDAELDVDAARLVAEVGLLHRELDHGVHRRFASRARECLRRIQHQQIDHGGLVRVLEGLARLGGVRGRC